MLIAVAFSACPSLGWLVVGSILLHELPQEILDFAMLISTGMEWKWALAMNFLSSLTALVSCIIVLALGTRMSGAAQGQVRRRDGHAEKRNESPKRDEPTL